MGWVDRVTQNGPMDNSAPEWLAKGKHRPATNYRLYLIVYSTSGYENRPVQCCYTRVLVLVSKRLETVSGQSL